VPLTTTGISVLDSTSARLTLPLPLPT
jgi:hypothetical protein